MSLLTVLEALEGPMEAARSRPSEDVVKDLYKQVEAAAKDILDIPLSEVLSRQEQKTGALVFQI
jgi:hypothetical protein